MQQLFLNAHKYSSLSVMQQPPLPVERGGDPTRSLGSPHRVHPPREHRHWGRGVLWGDPAPSAHRQLHPRSPRAQGGLFPCGFLGLARSQPLSVPGPASPALPAAGPAARSMPVIFSSVVAARSRCQLFLAILRWEGSAWVVLHCRFWAGGCRVLHVGAPWGVALGLLPLPGLCPLLGSPTASPGPSSIPPCTCLSPWPLGPVPRRVAVPSGQPHPNMPIPAPAACTAPRGTGNGDGQRGAAPLPRRRRICQISAQEHQLWLPAAACRALDRVPGQPCPVTPAPIRRWAWLRSWKHRKDL